MESRLPKPSGLKRPTPVLKNILPTDRIKSAVTGFGSKFNNFGSTSVNATQPLTRELTNLPLSNRQRGDRSASPEMVRKATIDFPARAKLRRSRSVSDFRDLRSLKRTEPTAAPFAAKQPRLGANLTTNTAFTRKLVRPTASVTTSTTATRRIAATTTTASRPPITARTAVSATNAVKNASMSASTTGAAKTIIKRIPPYDFKARFNDLLEKHKVLKEKYETKCEQFGDLANISEQFEESQAQLFSTQDQLKNTQTENECLHRQVKSQSLKIDGMTVCMGELKQELDQLKHTYNKIKTEHEGLSTEVIHLRAHNSDLTERNAQLEEELLACKDQLFLSNIERKELHNAVMDLRGNIRVFCRVRPALDFERNKLLCGWNYIDEATVEIQNPDPSGRNKNSNHTFSFDHVFNPVSNQQEIFELVSPLIQSALDGYNICIFAYGQTGSGKTYTMDGVPGNLGVIPRTVDLLFDAVQNYKRLGWIYEIRVTFLEIYNEVLYDLLSNEEKDMEIRMVNSKSNEIYVSNITQETVRSADRLRELMQIAKQNRATACTVGNERSSRSHAVTKIELIGQHSEKNEVSLGSINLVDLAGSESPKTSIRMNETKNINRSLSELTNVILALLQKQDHIPYRNSKLTYLLMPSLGGNSKTLMFINVAPFVDCYVESVKSLRFAASVNSCKMAKAKRNRFLNTSANGGGSTEK